MVNNEPKTEQEIMDRFREYEHAEREFIEATFTIGFYDHGIQITIPPIAYDGVMFRPHYQPDLNN